MSVKETKNIIKKNVDFKEKVDKFKKEHETKLLTLKNDEGYDVSEMFDSVVNSIDKRINEYHSIQKPTNKDKEEYINYLEDNIFDRCGNIYCGINMMKYQDEVINRISKSHSCKCRKRHVVKDTLNQHPFICSFSIGLVFILAFNGVSDFIYNRKCDKNG